MGSYPESYAITPYDGTFRTGKKYAEMTNSPLIRQINVQADLGKQDPAVLEISQSDLFKDGQMYFSDGAHSWGTEVRLRIDDVETPIGLGIQASQKSLWERY